MCTLLSPDQKFKMALSAKIVNFCYPYKLSDMIDVCRLLTANLHGSLFVINADLKADSQKIRNKCIVVLI
jgi:hypothetical protein